MNIEQEKMIVESLPSLYPMMQKFEEDAIHTVLDALPHWIPVTERLPEVGKSVLICDAYGDIYLGHRANYGYYFPDFCGDKIKDVRAWAELPEPYKGVTE